MHKGWSILAAIVAIAFLFGWGCADPNRELCRQACQRIYNCDKNEGNLDDAFLDSCTAQCEEADQINEELAKCLANSDCNAFDNCGSSSGE